MVEADIVKEAARNPEGSVLATILHTEGHAYRKSGAAMLLRLEGASSGTLSPGCLEADLAAFVPSTLSEGRSMLVEYDMRRADDMAWGEAVGCGGFIRVLLEPVRGELLDCLVQADVWLEQGETVYLIRHFREGLSPDSYRVALSPVEAGRISPGEFAVRLEPKPRLVLFGAGDDAVPVHRLAASAGFRVTVADFREAYCRPERFPGARTAAGFPAELMPLLNIGSGDYVVVMSHQFQRDREFALMAMAAAPTYLGIMGSAARTERMLAGIDKPSWLHYPVGLPIGADGPDEIAVSIAAELIAHRRRRCSDEKPDRDCGHLLGRREQQPDGAAQAVDTAWRSLQARRHGVGASGPKPAVPHLRRHPAQG